VLAVPLVDLSLQLIPPRQQVLVLRLQVGDHLVDARPEAVGSMSVPGKASVLMKSCSTLATRRFPTDTDQSSFPSALASINRYQPTGQQLDYRQPASFSSRSHRASSATRNGSARVAMAFLGNAIFGAARRVLDSDRRIPVVAQVIRAGSHVDLAGSRSQF